MPEPTTETPTFETVTELANAIRRSVLQIGSGTVEAEVRKINVSGSGHWYLELADAESVISAAVWRGTAQRIGKPPKQGDLVQAGFDKIDFYPPHGKVQAIINSLSPTGEGELLQRRQQTLEKLTSEGLTDPARRKPLPAFPRKIGLIAGKGSDAAKDVITALGQRFAPIPIIFCPSLVQGVEAPASVAASLATLNQTPEVDVIIVARGGGSVTDLSAFDDESLCRAIFASPVPVITSIGHTKDRPVCDHVSSAQSEVPARTAELAVAVSSAEAFDELTRAEQCFAAARRGFDRAYADVRECGQRISVRNVTSSYAEHLASCSAQLSAATSRAREEIGAFGRAFDRLATEQRASAERVLAHRSEQVANLAAHAVERTHTAIEKRQTLVEHQLQLVSAADISKRGAIFATSADGEILKSVGQVKPEQIIELNFTDGLASALVSETKEER